MENMKPEMDALDATPFSELVGADVIALISTAPAKVRWRVLKALDHYTRAMRLEGVDEEMAAIRLIAAEEELVVAIFEWLKLNERWFPDHRDFVRRFKNHQVKLAFYPVLSQFRFVLADLLTEGFSISGLEGLIDWRMRAVVQDREVKLVIEDKEGKEILRHDPLSMAISRGDDPGEVVGKALYDDFAELVSDQLQMSVKEFITKRADYRNGILYANDAGYLRMRETLADLLIIFRQTYHDLLWVLATLVSGHPPSKEWGLVSQFMGLYRRTLEDAGVLKAAGA
jgi:hypothetical protein